MKSVFFILILCLLCRETGFSQIFRSKNKDTVSYAAEFDTAVIYGHTYKNTNSLRMQYMVMKMYPLADTAVMLIREVEDTLQTMNNREERSYKKEKEKELKDHFEDRLKNLTRTEGDILIDLIERKTGESMYSILSDTKSKSTAFWWQNLGKMYGYNLKDNYDPNANPTLEKIIADYEAKHPPK